VISNNETSLKQVEVTMSAFEHAVAANLIEADLS